MFLEWKTENGSPYHFYLKMLKQLISDIHIYFQRLLLCFLKNDDICICIGFIDINKNNLIINLTFYFSNPVFLSMYFSFPVEPQSNVRSLDSIREVVLKPLNWSVSLKVVIVDNRVVTRFLFVSPSI